MKLSQSFNHPEIYSRLCSSLQITNEHTTSDITSHSTKEQEAEAKAEAERQAVDAALRSEVVKQSPREEVEIKREGEKSSLSTISQLENFKQTIVRTLQSDEEKSMLLKELGEICNGNNETISDKFDVFCDENDLDIEKLKMQLSIFPPPTDTELSEKLFSQVSEGDVDSARVTIGQLGENLDINGKNTNEDTLLFQAFVKAPTEVTEAKLLEVIQLLIEKGADLKLKNKNGESVIDLATEKELDRVVNFLSKESGQLTKDVSPREEGHAQVEIESEGEKETVEDKKVAERAKEVILEIQKNQEKETAPAATDAATTSASTPAAAATASASTKPDATEKIITYEKLIKIFMESFYTQGKGSFTQAKEAITSQFASYETLSSDDFEKFMHILIISFSNSNSESVPIEGFQELAELLINKTQSTGEVPQSQQKNSLFSRIPSNTIMHAIRDFPTSRFIKDLCKAGYNPFENIKGGPTLLELAVTNSNEDLVNFLLTELEHNSHSALLANLTTKYNGDYMLENQRLNLDNATLLNIAEKLSNQKIATLLKNASTKLTSSGISEPVPTIINNLIDEINTLATSNSNNFKETLDQILDLIKKIPPQNIHDKGKEGDSALEFITENIIYIMSISYSVDNYQEKVENLVEALCKLVEKSDDFTTSSNLLRKLSPELHGFPLDAQNKIIKQLNDTLAIKLNKNPLSITLKDIKALKGDNLKQALAHVAKGTNKELALVLIKGLPSDQTCTPIDEKGNTFYHLLLMNPSLKDEILNVINQPMGATIFNGLEFLDNNDGVNLLDLLKPPVLKANKFKQLISNYLTNKVQTTGIFDGLDGSERRLSKNVIACLEKGANLSDIMNPMFLFDNEFKVIIEELIRNKTRNPDSGALTKENIEFLIQKHLDALLMSDSVSIDGEMGNTYLQSLCEFNGVTDVVKQSKNLNALKERDVLPKKLKTLLNIKDKRENELSRLMKGLETLDGDELYRQTKELENLLSYARSSFPELEKAKEIMALLPECVVKLNSHLKSYQPKDYNPASAIFKSFINSKDELGNFAMERCGISQSAIDMSKSSDKSFPAQLLNDIAINLLKQGGTDDQNKRFQQLKSTLKHANPSNPSTRFPQLETEIDQAIAARALSTKQGTELIKYYKGKKKLHSIFKEDSLKIVQIKQLIIDGQTLNGIQITPSHQQQLTNLLRDAFQEEPIQTQLIQELILAGADFNANHLHTLSFRKDTTSKDHFDFCCSIAATKQLHHQTFPWHSSHVLQTFEKAFKHSIDSKTASSKTDKEAIQTIHDHIQKSNQTIQLLNTNSTTFQSLLDPKNQDTFPEHGLMIPLHWHSETKGHATMMVIRYETTDISEQKKLVAYHIDSGGLKEPFKGKYGNQPSDYHIVHCFEPETTGDIDKLQNFLTKGFKGEFKGGQASYDQGITTLMENFKVTVDQVDKHKGQTVGNCSEECVEAALKLLSKTSGKFNRKQVRGLCVEAMIQFSKSKLPSQSSTQVNDERIKTMIDTSIPMDDLINRIGKRLNSNYKKTPKPSAIRKIIEDLDKLIEKLNTSDKINPQTHLFSILNYLRVTQDQQLKPYFSRLIDASKNPELIKCKELHNKILEKEELIENERKQLRIQKEQYTTKFAEYERLGKPTPMGLELKKLFDAFQAKSNAFEAKRLAFNEMQSNLTKQLTDFNNLKIS